MNLTATSAPIAPDRLESNDLLAGPYGDSSADARSASGRTLRRWFFHRLVRFLTLLHAVALALAMRIGRLRKQRPVHNGVTILLTGRFDSDNWIVSHLRPLAASDSCSEVLMVTVRRMPDILGVRAIYAPPWLVRLLGRTAARLMTFGWVALRLRPEVVGAFHMLVNGMVAAVVGKLIAARTMYFCVSGPVEIIDGGVRRDSGLFRKMETPDRVVEKRLMRTAASFDLIVTMGSRAAEFFRSTFRSTNVKSRVQVIAGGIDSNVFACPSVERPIDLVFTGRLTRVKRIDVFIEAVRIVRHTIPAVTVAIIGDGELRGQLARQVLDMSLEKNVCFLGHQSNVAEWLSKSKVLVLTSDSEGLSLAVMEAMMSGLPGIVSNVGDMGDLVDSGVNGYLVERRSPEAFAGRIVELLTDRRKLRAFSSAARRSAFRYEVSRTRRIWDAVLLPISGC